MHTTDGGRSIKAGAIGSSNGCAIPGVEPLVPEGGLFVMVDVRGLGRPSDAVRRFLMHEAGVVVIHGSAYGPGGEGSLARLVRGWRRDSGARPGSAPRGPVATRAAKTARG